MRNFKHLLCGSAAAVALLCACNQAPTTAEQELTKSGINPADYDTVIAVAYDYENNKFVPDTANAKPVKLYTHQQERHGGLYYKLRWTYCQHHGS